MHKFVLATLLTKCSFGQMAMTTPAPSFDTKMTEKRLRQFISNSVKTAVTNDPTCNQIRNLMQNIPRDNGDGTLKRQFQYRKIMRTMLSNSDREYWDLECSDRAMIHKQFQAWLTMNDEKFHPHCVTFYNNWEKVAKDTKTIVHHPGTPDEDTETRVIYKPIIKSIENFLVSFPQYEDHYKKCNPRTIFCLFFNREVTKMLPLDRNVISWISRCSHEPGQELNMRNAGKARGTRGKTNPRNTFHQ